MPTKRNQLTDNPADIPDGTLFAFLGGYGKVLSDREVVLVHRDPAEIPTRKVSRTSVYLTLPQPARKISREKIADVVLNILDEY